MTRTHAGILAAAAVLLALPAVGFAQYRSDSDRYDSRYDTYDRDRYGDYQRNQPGVYRDDRYSSTEYDDYGRPYDSRYDTQRYDQRDQYVTQSRTGEYADLFSSRPAGDSRYVYGSDAPRNDPRYQPQADQWNLPAQDFSGQTIRGAVRRVTTETHDGVQHRHIALRTDEGRDITVDLGPISGLTQLRVQSGDQIRFMGDYRDREGRSEFIANRIQVNQEQRLFIERNMTQQWVQGAVIDGNPREGGVMLRTDEGSTVRIDLGGADKDVHLYQGQRLQALGTLARVGGEPVLLATQLRSLRPQQQASSAQDQQEQRETEPELDDEDYWRDVGTNLLQDIFRD